MHGSNEWCRARARAAAGASRAAAGAAARAVRALTRVGIPTYRTVRRMLQSATLLAGSGAAHRPARSENPDTAIPRSCGRRE
jgi:hypothetical protein